MYKINLCYYYYLLLVNNISIKTNTQANTLLILLGYVINVISKYFVSCMRVGPDPRRMFKSSQDETTSQEYIAAYTTTINNKYQRRHVKFDCDSKLIGIDNRCSACISPDIDDFIGKVTKTDKTIRGFGGQRVCNVFTGTIGWSWYDDQGKLHKFKIPHSYYVPDAEARLLSPQHWEKPWLMDRTNVIIVVKPRTQIDVYSSGTITNSRYPWTSGTTLQLSERQQVTGSLIYTVKNSRWITTKR